MRSFQRLKLGTEVDIDGMLVNEKQKKILYFKKVFYFLIYQRFQYLVYSQYCILMLSSQVW